MKANTGRIATVAVAALAIAASQPAEAEFKLPPPAPTIALPDATVAAKAAFDACKGIPIAFALVDSEGGTKLLMTGDGAPALFADFALRKATTALTFGKPSSQVRDEAARNPQLAERLRTDPRLIGFGGGLPIVRQGKPLGALAVAGAPSQDEDTRCATAAIDTISKAAN